MTAPVIAEGIMFNNLSIRKKLALLLVGPLLALLAIAGLGIRSGLSDLSSATDADRRVEMSQLNGRLFDALRAEAVQNQSSVIAQQNLDEVRAATDAASAAWLARAPLFEQLDVNDLIPRIQDIGAHRDTVTAEFATGGAGAEIVYDADMALLADVVAFDARLAGRAESSVASELLKASDLSDAALTAADAQLLGMWAAHSGTIPDDRLSERISETSNLLDAYFARALPAEQVRDVEGTYATLSAGFLTAAAGDTISVDPAAWEAASSDQATAIAEARRTLVNRAAAAADASSSDAQGTTRNLGALALIGAVLGLGALVVIGGGLRTRLSALGSEAAALANNDLPDLAVTLGGGEPTPREQRTAAHVGGSDEITDVAESLEEIRRATETVALQHDDLLQSGISDMFVNLARRNQTLVDRQLEVIDQLESNERDSDRLAQMYRVDHLATRMRRNAESLLVLAGQASPRRRGPAVELREVVRVAIGEVEDYRRIVPVALDDLFVAGHLAQDLAHLLSELMENATQSSAPGTVADVIGLADPNGAYNIQVIDRGTGLSDSRLVELNELLASPPSNSLSMSRSLGLTVVGRLAKRLAVSVALTPGNDGSGTVATVTIPADVVAEWSAGEPTAGAFSATTVEEPATVPIAEAPAEPAPTGIDPATLGAELDVAAEASIPLVDPTEVEQPTPVFHEPIADIPTPNIPVEATDVVPTTPSEVFGAADVPPLAPAAEAAEPESFFDPIGGPPGPSPAAASPEQTVPPAFEPVADVPAAPIPDVPAPPVFEPVADVPVAPIADALAPPVFEPVAEVPVVPVAEAPAPPTFDSLTPPAVDTTIVPPVPPAFEPSPAAPQADVAPAVPVQTPPPPPTVLTEPSIPDAVATNEPGAVFDLMDTDVPVADAPPAPPTPEPATTPTGLVRRRRSNPNGEAPRIDDTRTAPSKRSPDQVKSMLSRYKTGLERGRSGGQEPGQ